MKNMRCYLTQSEINFSSQSLPCTKNYWRTQHLAKLSQKINVSIIGSE